MVLFVYISLLAPSPLCIYVYMGLLLFLFVDCFLVFCVYWDLFILNSLSFSMKCHCVLDILGECAQAPSEFFSWSFLGKD